MSKEMYNEYEVPTEEAWKDLNPQMAKLRTIIKELIDIGYKTNDIELILTQEISCECSQLRILKSLALHKAKREANTQKKDV